MGIGGVSVTGVIEASDSGREGMWAREISERAGLGGPCAARRGGEEDDPAEEEDIDDEDEDLDDEDLDAEEENEDNELLDDEEDRDDEDDEEDDGPVRTANSMAG
jgi:hypothetical protein